MSAFRYFRNKTSVWLAAVGLILALVGLLVATGESIRHAERVPPLAGTAEPGNPLHDKPAGDAYRPAGSSVWMIP